jgi:hypothetical protein
MKLPLPLAVRQLVLLARDALTIRELLINRFTILLVVFLLLGIGTQGYINTNDDGRISGMVYGPEEEPVANANVTIRPIGSETVGSAQTIQTDENGTFVFRNQTRVLQFSISASKPGTGSSPEQRNQLYFRGQNTEVTLELTNTTNDR